MRALMGCSTVVGLVVFAVTFVIMLLAPASPDESLGLGEKLITAGGLGACIAFAVFVCSLRDNLRNRKTFRLVRHDLLDQPDVTEEDFLAHFSDFDPDLMMRIRKGLAGYFDVPVLKVHPTVHLRDTLGIKPLMPSLSWCLLCHVLEGRDTKPQAIQFGSDAWQSIADIAADAQRVLDTVEPADGDNEDRQPEADNS